MIEKERILRRIQQTQSRQRVFIKHLTTKEIVLSKTHAATLKKFYHFGKKLKTGLVFGTNQLRVCNDAITEATTLGFKGACIFEGSAKGYAGNPRKYLHGDGHTLGHK